MPFGFGVRIMPGVRIRASTRGIGIGLGPRAACLNVDTRGVSVSSGVGPFYASSIVGGRRRRSRTGSTQRSLKAYERDLHRAQREQEIAEVAKKEQQLVSMHLEEFPPSQSQQASVPAQVDRGAVIKDVRKRALSGIPWYKWSDNLVLHGNPSFVTSTPYASR